MIYPIVAYGDPILRKATRFIEQNEVDLKKLSEDMFATMHSANGVGLAAPQIGLNIRVFVVDATPFSEKDDDEDDEPDLTLVDFKKTFINPEILEESGAEWPFEEGCLSIPGIRGDVYRPSNLRIRYRDVEWNEHEEEYSGMAARIIQHEYDHLLGKLFVDYLPVLKKQFIKKKLTDISKGNVDADYRMRFPNRK
ncbi:Peptide deformylase [Dyadobacter sp. CECT 9623]|jgi:peptide deformylase|uniref:Peptide deformylase n=1 Tax=Dyadobacter linearis TaxID=2823330 RepID=A0ABM8UTP9_9BACT|nr:MULTISPECIES: peptide deformylase [unclassified Dyadobacter]MCE7062523.1 peptide deformylase [Dyadobacter sp. CY343]CAG5071701.1 Peptide deformylase [Dyadobacter sp. CECT 9623]